MNTGFSDVIVHVTKRQLTLKLLVLGRESTADFRAAGRTAGRTSGSLAGTLRRACGDLAASLRGPCGEVAVRSYW